MTTVIQMSLHIKVPGKRRQEALSLLRPMVEQTRLMLECMSSVLHQDPEDRESVWLVEEWATEASLMGHVKSDAFRMVFEVMELSTEVPDLRFGLFQELGGLDLVEQARQGFNE